MNPGIIKGFILSIILLLMQVMVLNNIHLFGCATPLLLVYIIITMPSSTPRWLSLTAGFTTGIISDIFSNTPGVAAASMTFIALIQHPMLKMFTTNESSDDTFPSVRALGLSKFLGFASILTLLFCITFFTLEQFSFFQAQQWFFYIIGSTILTTLLILTIEILRKG